MVAAVRRHDADAVDFRSRDGLVDAHGSRHRAEGAPPIDDGRRPVLPLDDRLRVHDDPTRASLSAIRRKANQPVGVNPPPVGVYEARHDDPRSAFAGTETGYDRLREVAKRALRKANGSRVDDRDPLSAG